jgi:hypothetical protein
MLDHGSSKNAAALGWTGGAYLVVAIPRYNRVFMKLNDFVPTVAGMPLFDCFGSKRPQFGAFFD